MDVTKILSIQALDFDIWGFHVKANLIMSVFILFIITGCWIWYKYHISKQALIKEKLANEKSIRDFEIEKQKLILEEVKLKQAKLDSNRKKPTWCHACDVNRVFKDWVPAPGYEDYIIKRYICPCCKSTDFCNKSASKN
ncbi:MAG: hypothetical protein K2Y14_03965 [Burkholderiales bacterium]|nr:hypothetical protein [Burkholderiales bacterium]